MAELFLVNANFDVTGNYPSWLCHKATHKLSEASDLADYLRSEGYEVKIQSIFINDKGYVKEEGA